MSRLTAGSVLVAMAVVALTLPVLASGYSYADDFSSGGYHGSTGSETWTAPWTEIGESDGPNAGSVTVSDSDLCTLDPCLLVQGLVGVNNVGIARKIELAAGDSADLRYDIDFPGGVLVEGSALVQASADGGSWKTLATHSPGTAGTFRVSLPNASSTIDIRFVTSGLSLLGSMAIDSVVINVARPATTTTTSTTTTSSSTSLTLVTTPLPTTLTLPTTSLPLITTTTTATSTTSLPTTTTPSGSSTTSFRTDNTTTVASRSDGGSSTTTSTTSTTIPRQDQSEPVVPPPGDRPGPPPPPSSSSGVVTRLDPGLRAGRFRLGIQAQENLAVRFVRASEHLGFDILANLLLGIFLAWASVSRLERRRERT